MDQSLNVWFAAVQLWMSIVIYIRVVKLVDYYVLFMFCLVLIFPCQSILFLFGVRKNVHQLTRSDGSINFLKTVETFQFLKKYVNKFHDQYFDGTLFFMLCNIGDIFNDLGNFVHTCTSAVLLKNVTMVDNWKTIAVIEILVTAADIVQILQYSKTLNQNLYHIHLTHVSNFDTCILS